MKTIFNTGRMAAVAIIGLLVVAIGGPASAGTTKVDFQTITVTLPDGTKKITDLTGPSTFTTALALDFERYGVGVKGGQVLTNPALGNGTVESTVYGTANRQTCTNCKGGVTLTFTETVSAVKLTLINPVGSEIRFRWVIDGAFLPIGDDVFVSAYGTEEVTVPVTDFKMVAITGRFGITPFYVDDVKITAGAGHTVSLNVFIPGDNAPVAPGVSCVALPEKTTDSLTNAPTVVRGVSASVKSATRRALYVAGGVGVGDLVSQSAEVDPSASDNFPAGTETIVGAMRAYAEDAVRYDDTLDPDELESNDGGDCSGYHKTFGTTSTSDIEVTGDGAVGAVQFTGSVYTPLGGKSAKGTGAIDWDLRVAIDAEGNYSVSGAHDGFPAYEVSIDKIVVYESTPGDGPYSFSAHVSKLHGGMDVTVDEADKLPD